jgi:hypothetical protein
MQDRPTLRELLDAVEDYLRTDLRPQLSGHAAFHTLVAANALAIVKRELDSFGTVNAAELERLRALLGAEGGLEELNRELCRRIRAGGIALDDAQLVEHLIRTTLVKNATDNPRYAGYLAALGHWPDLAPPPAGRFETRR